MSKHKQMRIEMYGLAKEIAVLIKKSYATYSQYKTGNICENDTKYINYENNLSKAIESIGTILGESIVDELLYGKSI